MGKQLQELRTKTRKELLTQCDELKKELHQLRVAQVSGGAPAKVANIRTTRKNIARIYTIISQITKQKVREEYARQKWTRKERLRLPKALRFKKTVKQRQLIKKFPRRKFAVIDIDNKLPLGVRQANVKAVLSEKKSANRYYKYMKAKQRMTRAVRTVRRERGINRRRKPRKKVNKDKDKQKA